MTSRPLIALSLVLSAFAFAASDARAGEAEAAEAFKAGASAYGRGDYRGAAASFERAYREAPRAAAIYNAGLAWEAAGDGARAADAYAAALAGGDLGATQSNDARTRLAALDKTLGKIEITAPQGATVSAGHVEGGASPVTVHVPPGAQDVSVRYSDGSTAKKSVTVSVGASTPVAFEPTAKAALAPDQSPSSSPPTPEPSSGFSTRQIVGFGALGGAVVASGAAVVLGLSALSAKSDFDASGHHDEDSHDRAASLRTMTNVAWATAAVFATAGVVLVITSPSGKASTTTGIGPRGAFVSVHF